ncbi:hypothetical protein SIM97_02835 [Pectobacterium zantedeschiae]|uniref:hypothetical protein n=1 Tax=Pectobacterium zantedeschiae TaxID=2034769 RepID=UPI003754A298
MADVVVSLLHPQWTVWQMKAYASAVFNKIVGRPINYSNELVFAMLNAKNSKSGNLLRDQNN